MPVLHSEYKSNDSDILIHGGGYTLETWYFLIQEMQINVQYLLVDLRGHGKSFDSDDFSLDTCV